MSQYIRIETTNACNLRCKSCPQSLPQKGKLKGVMSVELFSKIVNQVSPFRENREAPFYLHICGEPMLHPKLTELVTIAVKAGLKGVLTTNATLLTRARSESLVASGLWGIEFSWEGLDKEAYEGFRIRANYEETKANIFGFLDANKKAGNPVRTELVVVDAPQLDATAVSRFCDSMRGTFDHVNLSGYFDWLGMMQPVSFERTRYIGCSAPDTDLNVLWDGRVVPCCMDIDGQMVIGDFRSMSYLQILATKERKNLRQRLKEGDLAGLPCDRCAVPWEVQRSPRTSKSKPENE
jgi:organic radical activating enzyme